MIDLIKIPSFYDSDYSVDNFPTTALGAVLDAIKKVNETVAAFNALDSSNAEYKDDLSLWSENLQTTLEEWKDAVTNINGTGSFDVALDTIQTAIEQWKNETTNSSGTGTFDVALATMQTAMNVFFNTYTQNWGVEQTTGDSTALVMSQKAVTEQIKRLYTGNYVLYDGDTTGYFNGTDIAFGYKHVHFEESSGIVKLEFTVLKANLGVVFCINSSGIVSQFGNVIGNVSIDVRDYAEIYINFFGSDIVNGITVKTYGAVSQNYIDVVNADFSNTNDNITKLASGFVPLSFINGSYVNTSGEIIVSPGWARTDYIDCSNYKYLTVVNSDTFSTLNAFFDINKNFISYFTVETYETKIKVPITAKYVMFSNIATKIAYTKLYASYLYTINQIGATYNKMLCIGDSLTNASNWQNVVLQLTNVKSFTKAGSIGVSIADYGESSIYSAVQALTTDVDVDCIALWGGTNDWKFNIGIGDFAVQANTATRNTETFYGATFSIIEKLFTLYPKKRIIMIGTTPRTWTGGNYNTTPNGGGLYLKDYVDAFEKVANYYGIPFLNLLTKSGINMLNISEYMLKQTNEDGDYYLHFNDYGTQEIGKRISYFINSVG